jgi:hypothetical protein
MPRTKHGYTATVRTLISIIDNPEATIDQKLEACKILASFHAKFVSKPKTEKTKRTKTPTSKLLG